MEIIGGASSGASGSEPVAHRDGAAVCLADETVGHGATLRVDQIRTDAIPVGSGSFDGTAAKS